MTRIAREIIDSERDGYHDLVEPRDAATLIVIDRSSAEPKVLLGRRHTRHAFMPGKFVFPGGMLDSGDLSMPFAKPLHPDVQRRLLAHLKAPAENFARGLALAAIRETFEETGLLLGAPGPVGGEVPNGVWSRFVETGFYPDLSAVQLIARAITPPGFPRRYDARFFCADAQSIAHRLDNVVHADAELVELTWLPIEQARRLDLPVITGFVLQDLHARLRGGFLPSLPVPFYCSDDDDFSRQLIE